MPIAIKRDFGGEIRSVRILTRGEGAITFPANSPPKPGNTTPLSLSGGD
jgi:hypothetical protein